MFLPERYCEHVKEIFQDEYEAYFNCLDKPCFHGLRVNTDKISIEEFLKISPFHLTKIPWCENGFYYGSEDVPSKHPFYFAGLYYLQEPSAMAPASYLPIDEGDVVLDTCAAPGGKTTALGNRLKQTGLLVSNDISASRQNATLKNIERFGLRNIYVTVMNLLDMEDLYQEYFDKILVDAPCSGEGMFRKDPSLITSWQERDYTYYAPIQNQIIKSASKLLKPGGMLLYSTCTFSKEENEDVIAHLLESDSSFHIVDLPNRFEGFDSGIGVGFEKCARLYPHHIDGEGHFLCLLQKDGKKDKYFNRVQKEAVVIPEDAKAFLSHTKLDLKRVIVLEDKLLYLPDMSFNTDQVRVLRSGILVGTMKKNHFIPSQHLAFAVKQEEFDQVYRLSYEDSKILSYLKGETLRLEEERKGWYLVCMEDIPLGFAKAEGKTLKNKLDDRYRME